MVRKYIFIPINEKNNFNKENYLDDYIRTNFCKYIFKKGTYEGQYCNITCYDGGEYCKKHFKLLEKKKEIENKKNKVFRCIHISTYKCNRRSIENELFCKNHKSFINKNKKDNESNIHDKRNIPDDIKKNISDKVICNKIINRIDDIPADRKKQRIKNKRLNYKKNKKLKKKLQKPKEKENNLFNYNEILKAKGGILFNDKGVFYTYNLYEQKVIADCIDGTTCIYCNYIRYTYSGPCIYADCENRRFGDYEFIKYYKINNKELISKYNKRLKLLNNKIS